ncbi:MAG: hypothetical protein AMXMBFR36_29520 [Acidobacteriota bacterium]
MIDRHDRDSGIIHTGIPALTFDADLAQRTAKLDPEGPGRATVAGVWSRQSAILLRIRTRCAP